MLFVVLTMAEAASCTLTSKPFLVACGALGSLAGGESCKLMCLKKYRPTVATITCPLAGGTVSPSVYSCVPIQESLYPWQPNYCASVTSTGSNNPPFTAGLLGQAATIAAGEYSLTPGTTTTDKGVFYFGPVRTRGRRTAIELQFATKALATKGGDGFWAFVTSAVPVTPSTYTKPNLDPSTVFAVELDFFTDAAQSDPAAGNHVAVLFGASETHSAAYLSNLVSSVAPVMDGLYHTTNVLIQPISNSGSIVITVWYDGLTVMRDVVDTTNVPAALSKLIVQRSVIYVGVLSYNRASPVTTKGLRSTKDVEMCGIERPQYWHRLYTPTTGARVRLCASVIAFGNPDAARPGVWKPFPCPTTVPGRAPPMVPYLSPVIN